MSQEGRELISGEKVRDKAVAQASLGLVSVLLAGFSLTALEGIEITTPSAVSTIFILSSTTSLALNLLVVIETTLEYVFVMRELTYSAPSAWELMQSLRPFRRTAEIAFSASILIYMITTGVMLEERFAEELPKGAAAAQAVLLVAFITVVVVMVGMQRTKKTHQREGRHSLMV